MDRVSFVGKISSIMKATSDDDQPIPGYLYTEISNTTLESDGYCESTLEFLLDRLEKKSYHVKLKVLKLMKFLLENGHPHFKMGLQKRSHGVREATKYGGPPDPLHGNVPYIMVRKTAQELCEALFETVTPSDNVGPIQVEDKVQTVTTGLGPRQYERGGNMEGFGNAPVQETKSFSDSIVEGLTKLSEKIAETPLDQQRAVLAPLEKTGGNYKPPSVVYTQGSSDVVPTSMPVVRPSRRAPPKQHVPGRAGGGWDTDPEEDDAPDMRSSDTRSRSSSDLAERLENVTVEDWSTEQQLVGSTVDNGHTTLMTRSEIATFVKTCAGLNCDRIVEFLAQRLKQEQEYCLMRTMLLLEGMMTSDLVSLEHLAGTCQENLVSLYNSRQGPVKSKARKIIRVLEKLTSYSSMLPASINDRSFTRDIQINLVDITGGQCRPVPCGQQGQVLVPESSASTAIESSQRDSYSNKTRHGMNSASQCESQNAANDTDNSDWLSIQDT